MAKGQRRAAAPVAAPTMAPPPVPTEAPKPPAFADTPLDAFIAQHERAAQDAGLVVTAISHPDATERHHDGVYAGFPITAGELSATYSDGSKH